MLASVNVIAVPWHTAGGVVVKSTSGLSEISTFLVVSDTQPSVETIRMFTALMPGVANSFMGFCILAVVASGNVHNH